jgi:hypothetical protein
MFSKCSVDCIHSGKNIARHRDSNIDLQFCWRYLVVEETLNSDLRVCMLMPRYKSRKTIRIAEAMSCNRRSVNAGEVNDNIHSVCSILTYDNLGLRQSECQPGLDGKLLR